MSKRHPIDELFGQQLANSSAPVPEDMFSRIAQSRRQSRNKRLLGWTGLSSLGIGVLLIAWLAIGDTPELGYFPAQPTDRAPISAPLALAIADHQAALTTEETAVVVTTPVSQPLTNVSINSQTSVPGSEITGSTRSTVNSPLTPTAAITAISSPIATTAIPTDITQEETTATEIEAENEPTSLPTSSRQSIRMGIADALPNKTFGLIDRPKIKLFANHAPRCADFASPFFHFDVEVLAGPAYANQTLLVKTGDSQHHLDQRETSESAALSSSAAIRIAATTRTGLSIRSGLAYSQINERFTHDVGRKLDIRLIIGPNGDIVGRDTVYNEAYQDVYKNRLKFVEIPLLLGFEQQVGKFRLGLNAGAYLNLAFDAKGTVFSPATEEPIAFGQEGELNRIPIFERRATAAWYGGLSLAYNLHSRYSLLAEPYFKSYPRALSSGGYDLAQLYWTTGIQVGVRVRL